MHSVLHASLSLKKPQNGIGGRVSEEGRGQVGRLSGQMSQRSESRHNGNYSGLGPESHAGMLRLVSEEESSW